MVTTQAVEETKPVDPVMREKLNEAFANATSPIEYNGPNIFQVLSRVLMIAFSSKAAPPEAAKEDGEESDTSGGAASR